MANTDLMPLWKTEESNKEYRAIVEKLPIRKSLQDHMIHLTLFEEEVQYMMNFIAKHPQATEEELDKAVHDKVSEVTKKLGMTGAERDRYRG